jgi:radical SAM family uncharacterized protein/radical SAM-linked protein
MKQKLNEILPLVTKPIRYTGGEYNIYIKEPENQPVYFGLLMPEVYEIGMSNYGLKVLYSVLNRQENIITERAYAPWLDYGDKLRTNKYPLYSLESKRPLKEFNILGFSLQSELSYTNVLYILDLAEIPLLAKDRSAKDPLIIAGGPCCVNPLPIQDFIDCFVIGDGEEVSVEIAQVYENWNKKNRQDLLNNLSKLDGVYVPLVHNPKTSVIRKRNVLALKEEDFPYPPIMPICEVVHDRLTIEIGRGCVRGCRFCQAGIINRPLRLRPVSEVLRLAERGIRSTGWEEVSLLSLSASDYPYLQELVAQLTRQMEKRRVAISLPSMRGEDFSQELANTLQAIKKTGLTFAPETASSRLRSLVNKDISEDKIFNSITNATQAGWRNIKLYFMIGLPGEDYKDIDAMIEFVKKSAMITSRVGIKFSMTPFIPKPHTPLQWAGFDTVISLKEKMDFVKQNLRRRNTSAKWENPDVSFIQAILARGDEKLNSVILDTHKNNGIFQDWTEKFNIELWQKSFVDNGINPEDYLKPRDTKENLPWDFIDIGVKKDFLKTEYEKALKGELTMNCQMECQNCGVKGCDLNPNDTFKFREQELKSGEQNEPVSKKSESGFDFKLTTDDFTRNLPYGDNMYANLKFRMKYTVGETYRYAGHLDRVRAIYRTLRRSELPIAYTKGFSPHPIVSFGPPLPVGVISHGEYLDIEMARTYNGNIVRDLGFFMPKDIRIQEARLISRQNDSLGKICNLAEYEIKDIPWQLDKEALIKQKEILPGITNLVIDSNSIKVHLMIAPKITLYNTLQQLFQKDEAQVRCLNVERIDFYVLKNERMYSPMDVHESTN